MANVSTAVIYLMLDDANGITQEELQQLEYSMNEFTSKLERNFSAKYVRCELFADGQKWERP